MYTLGEAAKATGKSKATISNALKSGKISGIKGENGAFQIDPAELHRVFSPLTLEQSKLNDSEQDNSTPETLRLQLDTEREERERERQLMQDTIADLREDRDKWRQQATALLEDKRPKSFLKRILGR